MNELSEEQLARVYGKLDMAGRPPKNPPPPSTRDSNGGRIPPMSDWEPRVNRLENGLIGACVLIFSTIAASYFMLSAKADSAAVAITELKGSVKVLEERSAESNKRLERIEAKLDAIASKR